MPDKPRRSSQRSSARRWVFRFDQLKDASRGKKSWDEVKALLGGKGANLAEMTRLSLPVPPGFTLTTEACRAYLEEGGFPKGLWDEVRQALAALEKGTGKRLGDAARPLLVSCRSGAKVSMPGMMDTVLNIGLNDVTVLALASLTGDERFAWDSYRRLVQMFATVVLGVPDEPFERLLAERRAARAVANDADLPSGDLKQLTQAFLDLVEKQTGKSFPKDPLEQLEAAIRAVFNSWTGKRARDYRKAAGISDELGTAVNIVAMVFGNLGAGSATGVATTRNVSTGENVLEGDYLLNAQGEDVVSGTRTPKTILELEQELPAVFAELKRVALLLESHYREVQDIEFTVEKGKLWILQTRDAKRTARAAVRIAVDFVRERTISKEEALNRVKPEQVDFFLHPQFAPEALKAARREGRHIAQGLNVSPGAAVGVLAFDADTAEAWAKQKKDVIMIRAETKPDDVHGMLAARGIVTARGGRASHAALVARQFGRPAVVGVLALEIDPERRVATVQRSNIVLKEGDWVSIDGTSGDVFAGRVEMTEPALEDAWLLELLTWADAVRSLGVLANADYPRDAARARSLGAQGVGLCRTEHMFFETDRLPIVQQLIVAKTAPERLPLLAALLPLQRGDFEGLFRAMDGLPVTIRLIDPPLHEFLPARDKLVREVTRLETQLEVGLGAKEELGPELEKKRKMLEAVTSLHEQNPMLGLRGVRLGIHMPELVQMQVRAIFEAACACQKEGVVVRPKIMIPLVAHNNELKVEQRLLEEEARRVMEERGVEVTYEFGTMIEIPRAALTADQIAEYAHFFSFGTNDLTQTTYGLSRDDAETSFLSEYLSKGILSDNPFATLDEPGVGKLMAMAVELGRSRRPGMEIGTCGEHGGDPRSIDLCHRLGLTYVSCSPFRVPVARLAAAQAALAHPKRPRGKAVRSQGVRRAGVKRGRASVAGSAGAASNGKSGRPGGAAVIPPSGRGRRGAFLGGR